MLSSYYFTLNNGRREFFSIFLFRAFQNAKLANEESESEQTQTFLSVWA